MHRVGPIIRPTQHALTRGIVEVPFLLTIDRTTPPHQMIQPIILQGAGDPSSELTGRIAPTIITSRVIHRSLARTGWRGGGLRQVAQLMGMGTITIEVLLLSTASIHRSLPQLAQVGVGIPIGVIASQRALIRRAPARSIACRRHRRVVARPDQAVLLVITEVLRFVASGATLSGDGGFGGRATEHITHRIVAHLIVEERRPVALPRRRSAGGTQISIVAHRAGGNGRARAIGTEITHSSDESLSVVGQGRQIGHSGTVVADSGERSGGAIIRLAGRISAASSHGGLHHHRLVGVVVGLGLLILRERREGERASGDGHIQP